MQHARDGAIVDSFVRVDRLGVILLDHRVDVGELMQTVTHVGVTAGGHVRILLGEEKAQEAAGYEDKNDQEERATRTTNHLCFPWFRAKGPRTASERSIACPLPLNSSSDCPKVTRTVIVAGAPQLRCESRFQGSKTPYNRAKL